MAKRQELIFLAQKAAAQAYAPYSGHAVGAAVSFLHAANIYTGCNIENASYGLTICAERVAICSGVRDGYYRIAQIAIAKLPATDLIYPCGACLQFISEFSDAKTEIILANNQVFKLDELLPRSFQINANYAIV